MKTYNTITPIHGSRSPLPLLPQLVFFTLLFLSMVVPQVSPLSFNFSSFNQNTQGIDFQNDSFLSPEGIQLTKSQIGSDITGSVGRAVYSQPLLLWDSSSGKLTDFITHFSFEINAVNSSHYGDGLAFFLSPYPSTVPDNSGGGYLGLFNSSVALNKSSNQLVAVEFDTYMNLWDPNSDHVGININSIVSAANVSWNSSIKDGRRANAWVSYNGSTKIMSVFLTYADNPAFSGNSTLSLSVDLSKILPEMVAIGFSAATGVLTELHTILSWDFSSTLEAGKKSIMVGLAVGLSVGFAILMAVLGLVWFIVWKKKKASRSAVLKKKASRSAKQEEEEDYDVSIDNEFEKGRGPKRFPYRELEIATKNFAEDWKLGEGGFGAVYKGFLGDPKLEVAIKRVSKGSKQGKKEYVSEVNTISRLRHRNLVQLLGWCHERGEFMIVYEFMPNGSLDAHLYDKNKLLAWPERYKIALGLATALLYLHEEWEQCVVHRDVKPSNVMLDLMFNAKLGDFGLARFIEHDHGSQTTTLAGTMGYLAPECVTTGKASKDSDVYSFGVVALEIACGRRPVEPNQDVERVRLVAWVWGLYGRRMILEAADVRLSMEFEEQQMERLMVVGLWCAHPDYNQRPSIRQAIAVLCFEAPLPDLPRQMPVPTYHAPPLDMRGFTYTSTLGGSDVGTSQSSGHTIASSASTTSNGSSSEAWLLKSHQSDM